MAWGRGVRVSFPVPRPAQVLIDVTDLEQGAFSAAGANTFSAQLAGWLRAHPANLRVEPVRLARGRLTLARRFAWTLLGLHLPRPPDQAADLGPDSVVLFTAVTWTAERNAALQDCRCRGARLVLLQTEPPPAAAAQDLSDFVTSGVEDAAAVLFGSVRASRVAA